jgi:hypothetical protein
MTLPARVFQVDQMHCGNWHGHTVEAAESWLAEEREKGNLRLYYKTRGWIDPTTERGVCPWAATWYVEDGAVLKFYRSNWDTSG